MPWSRRLAAACAALALASALLAPPSRAQSETRDEAASQEIAAAVSGRVGWLSHAPKRGADAPAVARRGIEIAALREPEPPRVRTAFPGGAPPALERWRLAHSTSTSSP